MGLHGEGVKLVKEALEIYQWLGLINLTWLLLVDNQFSVIEEAAYHTITLLPGGGGSDILRSLKVVSLVASITPRVMLRRR